MRTVHFTLTFFVAVVLGCSRQQTEAESPVAPSSSEAELVQIEKELSDLGIELTGDFPPQREITERLQFQFAPFEAPGGARPDSIIRLLPITKATEVSLKQESAKKLLDRYQVAMQRLLADSGLSEHRRKALSLRQQLAALREKEIDHLSRWTRENIVSQTKRNRQAIEFYRTLWRPNQKRISGYFRRLRELDRVGIRVTWKESGLELLYEQSDDYEEFVEPLQDFLKDAERMARFAEFYERERVRQNAQAQGFEIPRLATVIFFIPILVQEDSAVTDEQLNLEVARFYAISEDKSQRMPGTEFPSRLSDLHRVRQFLFYFANYEMLNVRIGAEEDLYSFGLAPMEVFGVGLNDKEGISSLVVWNIPFLLRAKNFRPRGIRSGLERLRESTRGLRFGRYFKYWESTHPYYAGEGLWVNDLFRDSEKLAVQALALLDDTDTPDSLAKKLIGAMKPEFDKRNQAIENLIMKYGPKANQTYDEAIRLRDQELITQRAQSKKKPLSEQSFIPWYAELSTIVIYQYAGFLVEASSLHLPEDSQRRSELAERIKVLEAIKAVDLNPVKSSVESDLVSPTMWVPFPPSPVQPQPPISDAELLNF